MEVMLSRKKSKPCCKIAILYSPSLFSTPTTACRTVNVFPDAGKVWCCSCLYSYQRGKASRYFQHTYQYFVHLPSIPWKKKLLGHRTLVWSLLLFGEQFFGGSAWWLTVRRRISKCSFRSKDRNKKSAWGCPLLMFWPMFRSEPVVILDSRRHLRQ